MATAATSVDFDSEDEDDGAMDAQISSWEYGVAGDKELQQLLGSDKAKNAQGASGSNANSSNPLKKPWVGVTGHQRNVKFMYYFVPILKGYRKMQLATRKLRKTLKPKDPRGYTIKRQAMLDEQHAKAAPMIKKLLEEMGGLYNKAAQDIVTRGMVVPPQWVEELKDCFEDMPKRNWTEMDAAIVKGLKEVNNNNGSGGGSIRGFNRSSSSASSSSFSSSLSAFASIDHSPLAAASIGQVHCATTKEEGERVIIKVLYPEIRTFMAADLANLKQAVTMVSKLLSMGMKDTIEAVSLELYDNFPRELDFRIEMAFTERARVNLARHSPRVVIPKIYPSTSSTSILTQQRIEGDTIASLCKHARASANPEAVALIAPRKAFMEVLDCLGKQIFFDGFFHADPHPGNVMVQRRDNRPVLIDWGQCMELDRHQRQRLCEFTLLLRTRCLPLIGAALQTQGFGFSTEQEGELAALVYFFFDSATHGPFQEDILRMRDLVRYKPTKAGYITALPREVVFFGRVMTSVRRNCEDLQFDVSAIDVFAPFARAALLQMLGPSPPMRTLGKARHPMPPASLTQDEGEGLSRTMSAPAESPSLSSSSSTSSTASSPANNNNMHRSSSPVDSSSSSGSPSSHRKVALKARGKGHSPPAPPSPSTASAPVAAAAAPVESLWSPSRLVALLPLDPSAFELIEAMAGWAMDHTPVCDALLHLAGELTNGLSPSTLSGFLAGLSGDPKALNAAIADANARSATAAAAAAANGSSSSQEADSSSAEAAASGASECKRAYAEGLLAWQLLTHTATQPTAAYELARQGLRAATSLGWLSDHTQDHAQNNNNTNNGDADGDTKGGSRVSGGGGTAAAVGSDLLPVAATLPALATVEPATAAAAAVTTTTAAMTSSAAASSTAPPSSLSSSPRWMSPAASHAAKQRRRWSKAVKHLMATSSSSSSTATNNKSSDNAQQAPLQLLLKSFLSLSSNSNSTDGSSPAFVSVLWQAWQLAPPVGEWPPPMRMGLALGVLLLLLALYGSVDLVLVAISGEHAVESIARGSAWLFSALPSEATPVP